MLMPWVIFLIPVKMSDYQFKKYEEIRIEERKLDTSNRKKAMTGKGDSDSFLTIIVSFLDAMEILYFQKV